MSTDNDKSKRKRGRPRYLKKFTKLKKRKRVKKLIGVAGAAWFLNFARINQNKNDYSPTAINPTQQTHSVLTTDTEEIKTRSADCIQVKTGSGTVLAISKVSSDELQQVILVKDGNISKPTRVVGQVHGFTQPLHTPRKPQGMAHPGRPAQPAAHSRVFQPTRTVPRTIETRTQLEARRSKRSEAKKSGLQKGSGKKKGSGNPYSDDSTSIGKSTDSAKKKMRSEKIHKQFVSKKKKKKDVREVRVRNLKNRIDEVPALASLGKDACKSREIDKNINDLRDKLERGLTDPGLGSTCFGNCVFEHRARGGGRLYVKDKGGNTPIEILAKSGKKTFNQDSVIRIVKELYVYNNN